MKRTLALFALFSCALLANALCQDHRPNIIVILCDDLGYGDLGCYGHPHIKTPHLDQMAAEGIRYTACYSAAPVCSPSRVGLLTGRSPNRAGVYDWIPPADENTRRPDGREQVHLKADAITIPKLLKQAGYATCVSGKWHCNAQFNAPAQAQPGDLGFDHWFATQNNAAPSHANPRNYVRNGSPVGRMEGYSCQIATDEALAWMRDKGRPNSDEPPFFLYLAFHEPHEPVASPPELVAMYEDTAQNEHEAQYFANVTNIDLAVGRVLDALKRSGKDRNTLVFFTSDNGPETLKRYRGAERSYGRPHPLRGMKLWTTEAGFRVAGIARWPQAITPGQVLDTPVSSLDFLPTFCALAETPVPQDLKLDGTDFKPSFDGSAIPRPKPLLWCYYNAINEQRVAMRHGPWKLLAKLNHARLPKLSNLHSGNAQEVQAALPLTDIDIFRITEDIAETQDVTFESDQLEKELTDLFQQSYRELLEDSFIWKTD